MVTKLFEQETSRPRSEIEMDGEGITRLPFIAQAAMHNMAAMMPKIMMANENKKHDRMVDASFEAVSAAEYLWDIMGDILLDDFPDKCAECRAKEEAEKVNELKH